MMHTQMTCTSVSADGKTATLTRSTPTAAAETVTIVATTPLPWVTGHSYLVRVE